MVTTRADFWSGTTARARRFKSPLREFLRTESGGAAVLLAATAAALVWVNVDASSYEELWEAVLAIDLDGNPDRADAARVGEQRADDVLLLRAGSGGAAIYLAFCLGNSAAEGWGIAMSTDTAQPPRGTGGNWLRSTAVAPQSSRRPRLTTTLRVSCWRASSGPTPERREGVARSEATVAHLLHMSSRRLVR